jgi:hypothetical protein
MVKVKLHTSLGDFLLSFGLLGRLSLAGSTRAGQVLETRLDLLQKSGGALDLLISSRLFNYICI